MFFGFNTAVKGMTASKRALYTTGHNIDNTNTPGYSRQLVEQHATNPHRLPGIGFQGTGVEVTAINRARNGFVDYKYWNEKAPLGEWRVKNDSMIEIEKLMGEPSNNSFRQYMDDFYKSIEDMTTNPGDPSYRQPVIENAHSFTKHINEVAKRLENIKKDTENNISIKVDKINQLASQIATLNKQIYAQELDGRNANDLRDQRELMVDELSDIVNIRVSESPEGKYDVSIGGNSLVNHSYTNKISYDREETDPGKMIKWANGGSVRFKSGEVKGLLDMITGDGKGGSYRGIPFYEDQLNYFAFNYANKFNEQHEKGYDLEGNKGGKFFIIRGDNYDNHKGAAANIGISEEILKNPNKLAAAKNIEGHKEDNGNLHALLDQREDKTFFGKAKDGEEQYSIGTPDDFIKSIVSSMAVDSMQTDRFLETQKLLEKNLVNKRLSISGVSLNDEMSNVVKYQQVYVASTKMINTMDTLLDVTINRLGLVGR